MGTPDHGVGVSLHEFLSKPEWGEGIPLDELEFTVVHRGAPGDIRSLTAPEVVGRDRSYLHLEDGGRVPYHRVLEIRREGRTLWRRDVSGPRDGPQ
jgi:uncharacterized protein (UPF0248 family)